MASWRSNFVVIFNPNLSVDQTCGIAPKDASLRIHAQLPFLCCCRRAFFQFILIESFAILVQSFLGAKSTSETECQSILTDSTLACRRRRCSIRLLSLGTSRPRPADKIKVGYARPIPAQYGGSSDVNTAPLDPCVPHESLTRPVTEGEDGKIEWSTLPYSDAISFDVCSKFSSSSERNKDRSAPILDVAVGLSAARTSTR